MSDAEQVNPRLVAYLQQTLLRLYSASPALIGYLESSRVKGKCAELSFYLLPDEVTQQVLQSLGCSDCKMLTYCKKDHHCVGFRITPTDKELESFATNDGEAELPDVPDPQVGLIGEPDTERTPTTVS